MKTKLIVLFVVTNLLVALTVQAASRVLLRLNLQKGSTYEMTMISDNNIDQEMSGQKMKILQKVEMLSTCQVLDILPDNNFLIEYSIQKMKINMNVNGKEMNSDSDSTGNNPMNGFLKDLSSLKMKIKLNSKGQVQEIEGLEEYAKKMSGNPQMSQSMKMFTDEKNFKSYFEQTFSYFPENEIEVGSKWSSSMKMPALMNMDIVMNFEVANILNDQVLLNVVSNVNMETPMDVNGMKMNIKMAGTQTGTMAIALADGCVGSSDCIQKYDVNMKMKNPQSGEDMEIPMVMNSVIKSTVVRK